MKDKCSEELEDFENEFTVVDLHVHPSMQEELFHRNLNLRYVINRVLHGDPLSVRASFPLLKCGGYDAILSMIYVPEKGFLKTFPVLRYFQYLFPGTWNRLIAAPPYQATLNIMEDFEKAAVDSRHFDKVKMVHSLADLDAIFSQPKGHRPIAAIHAIEGAHSLGGENATEDEILTHLKELFDRGVIYITLAHFFHNEVANPCYPWPENIVHLTKNPNKWTDLTLGLTRIGKDVVEKMIEMGMLIDLTHSSPATRKDIYEIAKGKHVPLLATHVGAYGINPSPYNLTDDEIRFVSNSGGVIGVIFMPYWLMPKESGLGINSISQHIQYLINVGGEDVVGLGTDFDGFTTPPDDLDNAAWMPRLTKRLIADGHSLDRIKKIMGVNALRAIHDGWGKKS